MRSPIHPTHRIARACATTPTVCETTACRGSYLRTAPRYAGRCEKKRPVKHAVAASTAHPTTTCTVCVRSNSRKGCRAARLRSRANSGDSSSERRSKKLSTPPRPPSTNAIRHPYDATLAGSRNVRTDTLTTVATATPMVTHANTTPHVNGALRGAVSTTYVNAPGSSPPRQNPCTRRKTTINTLAAMPHCAYEGTSPIPNVAADITKRDHRNTCRRPYLSP